MELCHPTDAASDHEPPHPRAGWDEAFARQAAKGDDQMLGAPVPSSTLDEDEWEWPQDHDHRSA